MTIEVKFSLEEQDLVYFKNVMKAAQSNATNLPVEVILANAKAICSKAKNTMPPEFVENRLHKLGMLIAMVEDPEWDLPAEEHKNIIAAITYFNEAEDLVPDHVPVLGLLDDAIMIELVSESLTESIKSYEAFINYRECELARCNDKVVTKKAWLADKNHEVHYRLRRRHSRSHSRTGAFHSMF